MNNFQIDDLANRYENNPLLMSSVMVIFSIVH